MLLQNTSIEKTMQVDSQIWYCLEVFGEKERIEIFISLLDEEISGITENNDNSLIFFKKNYEKSINKKLNENNHITNWNWSIVKEENWNKSCEDFFKPVTISNKVQIIPKWYPENNNYMNIIINPALAFGTGHHETTFLMIEEIIKKDLVNKTVIDIGTGSGILSILAKKMNAKSVYAIDNDLLTNNNFYENLELNTISDIDFEIKDCFDLVAIEFDYIFANINFNVLKKLIPMIKKNGTTLIISGVLLSDKSNVVNTLEKSGKKIKNISRKKEWICITAEI
ncbi:MAG: hypothetical protein CMG49_03685 [Candidatus Marinimicrobia bacterium]|nr:hypothetical protein [Candidatus Neomarinimicrobiota bacterium]